MTQTTEEKENVFIVCVSIGEEVKMAELKNHEERMCFYVHLRHETLFDSPLLHSNEPSLYKILDFFGPKFKLFN